MQCKDKVQDYTNACLSNFETINTYDMLFYFTRFKNETLLQTNYFKLFSYLQTLDPNTLVQLQQLHKLLLRQSGTDSAKSENQAVFDRKLLDFDYGSDEDDVQTNPSPRVPNSTNNNAVVETVGR